MNRIIQLEPERKPDLVKIIGIPFLFVLLLWIIKYSEWKFNLDLSNYGLYPLTLEGLRGILFAPLLHGDFYHLLSNSIPMMILGAMMFYFYEEITYKVFFMIYFFSEAATWFFARPNYHIGASGLVYGLVCFLCLSGIIRQNVRLLALSLLVVFLYGGLVWGIVPLPNGLSWETHLSGSITGIICALLFRKQGPQKTKYEWENEDEENELFPVDAEPEPPIQESPLRITYIYKPNNPEEETKPE